MKLLLKPDCELLLANGHKSAAWHADGRRSRPFDPFPVVKLFTPDAGCTWLLTELDPEEPDIVFGLCDLGLGFPELGTVRLSELGALRGRLGLPVERDRGFRAVYPLSVYARAAWRAEAITFDAAALAQADQAGRDA